MSLRTFIKEALVKLGGWRAPVFFGGASDVDRWKWVAAHAEPGRVRTLDAGSGLGALSFHAAKLGNQVVAISFVPENNQKARTRARILGLDNIEFIDGDLRVLDQMSPKLGKFDQIYCVEVIEHVIKDEKLLHDLSALLKPGGKLLLSTPYQYHRPISDETISEVEDGGHVRFGYTGDELRRLLNANGFDVVSEELITGFVCQQIDNVFRSVKQWTNRDFAWTVSFPLRIFQGLDGPLTRLTRWPALSIAMVAKRRDDVTRPSLSDRERAVMPNGSADLQAIHKLQNA
jgi:2-polyprenyl-3-methyl-5-hydroxy-6-metoxy-1,4-benzoquinol methylase